MKKNYFKMSLSIFAISLFANTLFAQGAFVNFNVGYGFKMSSQNIDYFSFYNQTSGNNSTTNEQVYVSFGKGFNIGGTFGYMFSKNIGAELGLSYLIGGKSKAKDESPNHTIDYTLSANMFRINPSLIITPGFEKFNPYAKFGMVIGIGSIKYEYTDKDDGDITVRKWTLNGGTAIGLTSALGMMYNLSDKLSLFGELNMVNLSYAPTNGKLTEATKNGADQLSGMTTSEKETEYSDKYTYSSPALDSQPRQELKEKMPFGSIGLNFGLRYNF